MDIRAYNRAAWDKNVERQNKWTVPISTETVRRARQGEFDLLLTPTKPVPMNWFPALEGAHSLCLASGGGQQGPLLAAAGAVVTVFDNSPKQLEQDRLVANRDGLVIDTVEGDMADLSMFADQSFDLIVHPASNVFVPEVRPVWREAFRVLRQGGVLMAGFVNPVCYIFDDDLVEQGQLEVTHSLPYSDLTSLTDDKRQKLIDNDDPLVFGHLLEDQIGGQVDAGFAIVGFYEDRYPACENDPLSKYMPNMVATRAVKSMLN